MVSGKGCTLTDNTGKVYLDFVSGIATCALGHSNQELTDAITNQMATLHHCSNLYLTPQQGKLAAWLVKNSVADKIFFCNSGAEANEGAIKLARRHASNRGITDPVIITALQSFHGRTLAAVTATAQPKYHKGFGYGGEMVRGFQYVPYNDMHALEQMVREMNKTPVEDANQGRCVVDVYHVRAEIRS
jgi:acetylornithine aminotransferase